MRSTLPLYVFHFLAQGDLHYFSVLLLKSFYRRDAPNLHYLVSFHLPLGIRQTCTYSHPV